MARLIERVRAGMHPRVVTDSIDATAFRPSHEASRADDLRVIDGQQVAAYMNSFCALHAALSKDANYRPPFPNVCVEWMDRAPAGFAYRAAAHVLTLPTLDGAVWSTVAYMYLGTVSDDALALWAMPFRFGLNEGERIPTVYNEDFERAASDPEAAGALGALYVGVSAFRFMNYRNARLVEHAPTRAERRRAEREGTPVPVRYHTIEIDPMRPKHQRGTAAEEAAAAKAWHMVRGHEVTYHAEAPLFGNPKNVGTYWRSAHERGDKARGAVVSDYRVALSPTPTDAGR